jgi:ADP-ribose pyrophosphatase
MSERILVETPYLRLIDRDGWFFVDRPHPGGVVMLVAVTPEGRLLLVEQHRPPLARQVIELPAGLVGDAPACQGEALLEAAARELIEETGWKAGLLEPLASCATAPGLASEVITFVQASSLEKVGPGGGVDGEQIRVHEVPLPEVPAWLDTRARAGGLVASNVYAGLWLAQHHASARRDY